MGGERQSFQSLLGQKAKVKNNNKMKYGHKFYRKVDIYSALVQFMHPLDFIIISQVKSDFSAFVGKKKV